MPRPERLFCRSAVWQTFSGAVVLPWALQSQQLSGDVLEIGAGSGAMAAVIAKKYPDVHLTVTDYDLAMLERNARNSNRAQNMTVRQADAIALPFEDRTFDAVLSFLMLHHIGAWQPAIAEIGRVLRPGGFLIGYDLTDHPISRAIHRIEGAQHATQLVGAAELRTTLQGHPFTDSTVDSGRLGLIMKFHARRQG